MVRAFDRFMAGNLVVWSLVICFGYRWRHLEFYIYVLLVLLQAVGMAAVWGLLRRFALPAWLLILLEVAILLHLAGGSLFVGGIRLYDVYLMPAPGFPPWMSQAFRYDKLVHLYFAAVGLAGLRWLWPRLDLGPAGRPFSVLLMVLIVMGVCALVEVAEYAGTKVVSLPEVGGYDNNLQDLLANLVGAAGAALWARGRP
ncbi:MAG TPA: DUF2238 domain-containing protein [Symbiobacteriaceae bacterium]|nr:DUF2238 domain-containing protein [Symbiobacteriaceae bacterium]